MLHSTRLFFTLFLLFLGINLQAQTGTTCTAPTITAAPDSNKIIVNWTGSTLATATYTLEYAAATSTTATPTWISAATATPNKTFTINNLTKCTYYAIRLKMNCSATSSSTWTTTFTRTKGCAIAPICSPITTINTISDSNKITLNWAGTIGTTYTIEHATAPFTTTTVWSSVTATTPTYTFNNLAKCKEYAYRIKVNCSATNSSAWSSYKVAKTTGCTPTFCPKPAFQAQSDTTKINISWTSTTGTTYQLQYAQGIATTATTSWTTVTTTSSPTTINNLLKCTNYTVRLRANCGNGLFSDWNYLTIKTGCIISAPTCAKPAFQALVDTANIKISWISATATTYQLQYVQGIATSATTSWTTVTTTSNPATIANLLKCTNYTVRLRANCGNNLFSDWNYLTVKTTGCIVVPPCVKPGFQAQSDSTSIKLTWTSATATTYQLQYALGVATSATTTWTTVTTTSSPTTISNLLKCTNYTVRLRANCGNGLFSDWNYLTIKTGCPIVLPCSKPIFTLSADTTNIKVNWIPTIGVTYAVAYTKAPETATSVWTTLPATTSPATITSLMKCMEYVVRMKAYCSNNTASEWEKKTIKTTGCQSVTTCVKPEILSVTADSNKVTIVTNGNATTWYTIEYTAAPQTATSTWTNLASMSFTSVIPNLQKCKEYVVRVRTFCTQTLSSDWVYRTVKTTGCVQAICPKPTITNVLADSTKAGFTWTAIAGMTYQAAYTPNPVTATSAWTSISVTPNNGAYIVGLIKCKEYRVRVRTVCSSDYFSDWDYKTFKTIGCAVTTPCIKPAVLTSTPITGGTVLNWVGSSQCYQVRYAKKTTTAAVWKTDSICATTHTVLNLDACTFYAWQVRARCADGSWSDWTSKATFETGGCSERIAKTMNIYPNPGAYLNVDYYLRKSGKVSLEITNLQGISVGKYELGNQEVGQNKFNLDNLNFAAGSYLITIKLNGVRLEVQRWMKTTE